MTGTATNQFPTKTTILGVPAVLFNVTADGVMDNVTSSLTYFPQSSWFGFTDWTIEYWVWGDGYSNGGANPIGQLGVRPAVGCDTIALNYGPQPSWGSISFWSCDYPWVPTSDQPADILNTGAGYMPLPNKWNHVVYTYSGNTGSPAYQLNFYLNGVLYTSVAKQLAVRRVTNPLLGGWSDGPTGGVFALAQFRVHDGALTSAQAAYNYAQFSGAYIATYSPTASVTASASGTQLYSFTPTATHTPTSTPVTITPTPTASAPIVVATKLLIGEW